MKAYKEIGRKYYKYYTETGEYNAGGFSAYKQRAVTTATGSYWSTTDPFILTSVEIKNGPYNSSSAVNPYIGSPRVLVQVNGAWQELCRFSSFAGANVVKTFECTGNTTPYTSFALRADSLGQDCNDLLAISYVIYRGYYYYPVEATEQDYDFYKDVNIYKVIKSTDVYKALKSQEKGQYYGN